MFGCCSDMGYETAAQNCLSMHSIVCYCYCKIMGWKVKKKHKTLVGSHECSNKHLFFFLATSDLLLSLVCLFVMIKP